MQLLQCLELLCLLAHHVYAQQFAYYVAQPQQPRRPHLILYNPFGGEQMEPLRFLPQRNANLRRRPQSNIVTGNILELPQLWQPCTCTEYMCMCCLGMSFGENFFNQRVCVILEYASSQMTLQIRIEYNQRTLTSFELTAQDDYCVPLLLPLPLFSCLRFYDIRPFGSGNVQLCMSVVFKVFANQLFEYHFDCVRFGSSGVGIIHGELSSTEQQPSLPSEKLTEVEVLPESYNSDVFSQITQSTTQRTPNNKLESHEFYRLGLK